MYRFITTIVDSSDPVNTRNRIFMAGFSRLNIPGEKVSGTCRERIRAERNHLTFELDLGEKMY